MARSLYPASVDAPDLSQPLEKILQDFQAAIINIQNHLGISSTSGDLVVTGSLTGVDATLTGTLTLDILNIGVAEDQTVASGVLTVTQTNTNVLPQSSTTDTVDSITWAGVAEGDILLCRSEATNTITFDNSSTLLLGSGTRAVAPGGCIMLIFHGTTWVELFFLAAAS